MTAFCGHLVISKLRFTRYESIPDRSYLWFNVITGKGRPSLLSLILVVSPTVNRGSVHRIRPFCGEECASESVIHPEYEHDIFYILLKINMLQITLVRRPHSRMRTTNRYLLYLIVYQHYPKTRCSWSAVLHGDIRWKYCRVWRGLPAHLSGGRKDFKGRTKLSAEDGEKLSIKERCQLEG